MATMRMGWDSNPGYAFTYSSFQDCRLRPLGHPSGACFIGVSCVFGPWSPSIARGLTPARLAGIKIGIT